jgi:NAD(P)-dependent dehydrogenase (short-subunit alcohol dehydrogenase family)
MGKLDGKVAVVTGGGSGIGRATCALFAEEGARVVVAERDEEHAVSAADEIVRGGGEAVPLSVDVSDPAQVEGMVRDTVARYGGLDVLFNNAGIEGAMGPVADCPLDNWRQVIDTNLGGVFYGMKYAIPEMLKRGGGVIINNASVAGLVGFAGLPAYCASKGGVVQLTRGAALEYAKQGIRVNVICPGVIWTPMVERVTGDTAEGRAQFEALEPVGRFGTAAEVARLALFLASDDSSFCTGAPFIVDGGFVAG